jgi:hypothetical protein
MRKRLKSRYDETFHVMPNDSVTVKVDEKVQYHKTYTESGLVRIRIDDNADGEEVRPA